MSAARETATQPLYTAEQVRMLDRAAIEGYGLPATALMERAGRAAFALMQARYPGVEPIYVVCGTGNNGGDGLVLARLAAGRGLAVRVGLVGDEKRIAGAAHAALVAARASGVALEAFAPAALHGAALVVDALLGTGASGAPRLAHAQAILAINRSNLPVLALDLPSGLCADSGSAAGAAVRAEHTISFIGRKRGLYTGAASDLAGQCHFSDLAVPQEVYRDVAPAAELLSLPGLLATLAPRPRSAHKGRFGHVLVVGGAHGMAGAAAMAAEAAARSGAGLVSVATQPANVSAIVSRCPELMANGVEYAHQLEPLLARATVVVCGPGLGRGPWSQQLLQCVLAARLPVVLDADALNAIAMQEAGPLPSHSEYLLTPHAGEAARLLGTDTGSINADRFAAVARLGALCRGAVVLKGAGTLVLGSAAGARVGVCPYGNPGMASGGMGDVLSGILGALLAQGMDFEQAARLGVCLHARAADLAACAVGERGLLATDLLPCLRLLLNGRGGAEVESN